MPEIARPALRYHGGKWQLAPWILAHFPPHRIYTEAFGGAASVLLQKPRSYAEVYNDLDGEIVHLFRVLREPKQAQRLIAMIRLTPFARGEFVLSYERCDDPVEQARRTCVRSFMGFGSDSASGHPTGFRSNAWRNGTVPAHDWAHYPDALGAIVERLRGVVIEHRDALAVIRQHDRPDTLHYADPPYVHSTRESDHRYRHEMSDSQHGELAALLHQAAGMVVLSGYRSDLYDALYGDWQRLDRPAFADGARPRTECLWISPRAAERMRQMPLWQEAVQSEEGIHG